MILKELYITDDIRVPFHDGLNIILAKNKDSEYDDEGQRKVSDTNGVGKSSIVNLLRYLLGGEIGQSLQSDFFTQNDIWANLYVVKGEDEFVIMRQVNSHLSDYVFVFHGSLEDHKIWIEQNNFSSFKALEDISAKWEGEKYKIYEKDEFRNELSRLENIDYSNANMRLSALLDFIIRDEIHGFGDIVMRPSRSAWVLYRSIQYLFNLPFLLEENVREKKDIISRLSHDLGVKRKFLADNDITNIDSLENKKLKLEAEMIEVQQNFSVLNVSKSNEKVRTDYRAQKEVLINVNYELNFKESQLVNVKNSLEGIREKNKAVGELIEAEAFFKDSLNFFSKEISENISKYNSFFNSLGADRVDYYKTMASDLTKEIRALRKLKLTLENSINEISSKFNNPDLVRDISVLAAREENIKAQIKNLEDAKKYLSDCDLIEEDIDKKKAALSDYIKDGKRLYVKNQSRRSQLIQLFLSMVKNCYGTADAVLAFSYIDKVTVASSGRTDILCSISSDASRGRTNAKICLFDLTWFLGASSEEGFNPEFLIHDGPFGIISTEVKNKMLKMADEKTLALGKQYIITANDMDLNGLDDFSDKYCIELDGSKGVEGKFFRSQYD